MKIKAERRLSCHGIKVLLDNELKQYGEHGAKNLTTAGTNRVFTVQSCRGLLC